MSWYYIRYIFIQFSGFYSEISFASSNCSNIDQLRQFSNHPRALLILILHDCLECRSGVSSHISKLGAATSIPLITVLLYYHPSNQNILFCIKILVCSYTSTGHSSQNKCFTKKYVNTNWYESSEKY